MPATTDIEQAPGFASAESVRNVTEPAVMASGSAASKTSSRATTGAQVTGTVAPDGLPPTGAGIVDAAGQFGTVIAHQADSAGGLTDLVVVRHREQQVLLPAAMFTPTSSTSFRIPVSFDQLVSQDGPPGKLVIPVMQEELSLQTRVVDSGRGLHVRKTVVETPQVVEQSLQQEVLAVEHVPRDRLLDDGDIPQSRYEGTTLVIPVVEEVLVVQVRRRLKEEIRITRGMQTVTERQTVLLKSEQVEVERFDEHLGQEGRRADTDTIGVAPGLEQGASPIAGRPSF